MATINYTAPDGTQHRIPLPEGADPNQVVAEFEVGQNFSAPTQSLGDEVLPSLDFPADLPTSIAEATEGRGPTLAESVKRGLGLGARMIPSAVAKIPAAFADIGATALNLPIAGLDKLGQLVGDEPLDVRLPAGSTENVDLLLDEIFPKPESFGERVLAGTSDLALAGITGGAALVPKAAAVIGEGIPRISAKVPSILEAIGQSFAKSPKTFAALETTGAGGAVTAGDLAEQADAGPGAQIAATLTGGLLGVVAPQTLLSTGRRTVTGAKNVVDKLTQGERSAAKILQEQTADPQAAAVAVRKSQEGVLPARATEEPRLRALEEKVIADDPTLAAKVAADLEAAEARSLNELADAFGPTSDKTVFQQTVIERGAAPGTKIKAGQPDEMLDQAARSYDQAYKEVEGFEIRTQDFSEPNVVPLQNQLDNATIDTRVIAGKKTRRGIADFLSSLLADVSRRGPTVGPADSLITRLRSEDLIEMRQLVRQEIRSRSRPTASTKAKAEARLLQNANDAITSTLESQLPADAASALRATDARYRDFITVQGAVLRSGEKGLTPEALRASVKATAASQGQFARGATGDLGKLAEQGKNVASMLAKGRTPGKPDQMARTVRDMTSEQLQVVKADLNEGLAVNATIPATGALDGKKLLVQLEANREVLNAAGFTKQDISRIETIAKQLKVVQSRSPAAATKLLNDDVGRVLNLAARIAGSKSAQRIGKIIGGVGGLIIPQFTSKTMQEMLQKMNINNTQKVLRAAFDDKELFAALMVKPTDSLKRQAEAARTLKAFLLEPVKPQTENENE